MQQQVEWDRVVTLADGTTSALPEVFWELVARAASERPDAVVAYDEHGRSLTRARLRDDAARVAAALTARGVGRGTVVSWQLPTCLEALVLMTALARVGAVQNPVIPLFRHKEVRFITHQVGTDLFVCPPVWRGFDHAAMAAEVLPPGAEVLLVDLAGMDRGELCLPAEDDTTVLPPPPPPGGVRWLYHSSGTTSDPKGVRHRDDSVTASCAGMLTLSGFGAGDVYPIAWPLAHIGGVTMLTTSLMGGVSFVLCDSYDPATTPDVWATFQPTIVGSAVPFFRAYLDAQARHGDEPLFPRLRVGAFGGAPVAAEVHDEVRRVLGVKLVGSYGLTEFPIATSATAADPLDVLVHTVGRPSPAVEVRIVTADETLAGAGVEGEVRLRGPQCFEGYLDESLDAAAFDADGFFRTGDLGVLDDAGNVRITGRLKDIVIRNAENISVLEVEELLYRHPAIVDAAVFGMPDARTGERVCAAVVLRGDALTLDDLRSWCRAEGLAIYKCPEQLEVVDELPRTGMGKVLKHELRRRLLATG